MWRLFIDWVPLCFSHSEKLGVEVGVVQHGVEGLMYLLTECSKLWVNELDFQDSIMVLGFPDQLNKELLRVSTFSGNLCTAGILS